VGRAGTPERPLVRLSGLDEPERVAALRGEPLLVPLERAPLEAGEWLAEDLMGCEVPGLGRVGRVLAAPSCDLLEVGPDAVLVPLVADAVKRVDTEAGRIEIDRGFLGLDEESPHET
jgi:ribosomal 30S subunit maturation factor RimM